MASVRTSSRAFPLSSRTDHPLAVEARTDARKPFSQSLSLLIRGMVPRLMPPSYARKMRARLVCEGVTGHILSRQKPVRALISYSGHVYQSALQAGCHKFESCTGHFPTPVSATLPGRRLHRWLHGCAQNARKSLQVWCVRLRHAPTSGDAGLIFVARTASSRSALRIWFRIPSPKLYPYAWRGGERNRE